MTSQPSIRRTTTLTRELIVLKRAEVTKANAAYFVNPGDVISLVKNGEGRVYTTILRRNTKRHSCTCEGNAKWHRQCWHIKHCAQAENARFDAAQARAARKAQAEAEMAEITRIAEEAKAYGEKLEAIKAAEMAEALAEQAAKAKEAESSNVSPLRQWCDGKLSTPELAKQVLGKAKSAKEDWRDTANLGGTRAFSIYR